jgi:Fe-S cluster biogenesis protein NfuA
MADLHAVESRIEELLAELGRQPGVRERAEELVRLLIELYGECLGRVTGLLPASEMDRLAADDLVGSLLILHDLHPHSTMDRVHQALERVRPYLGSHAGGVELLGLDDDGAVRLRLEGTCQGCPSSTVTVKLAIERAILDAAPEVTGVRVDDLEPERELLQIQPRPPLECPAPLQDRLRS